MDEEIRASDLRFMKRGPQPIMLPFRVTIRSTFNHVTANITKFVDKGIQKFQ